MADQHPHTPTTEEVRDGYSRKPPGHAVSTARERHGEEFDRWHAAEMTAAELAVWHKALRAVLSVHKRKVLYKSNSGKTVTARCEHCYEFWSQVDRPLMDGEVDTFMWPCDTVRAITDAMEGDDE